MAWSATTTPRCKSTPSLTWTRWRKSTTSCVACPTLRKRKATPSGKAQIRIPLQVNVYSRFLVLSENLTPHVAKLPKFLECARRAPSTSRSAKRRRWRTTLWAASSSRHQSIQVNHWVWDSIISQQNIQLNLDLWKGVREATFRGCETMSKFQASLSWLVEAIL